jgi:hypothetical protein
LHIFLNCNDNVYCTYRLANPFPEYVWDDGIYRDIPEDEVDGNEGPECGYDNSGDID